MLRKQTKKILVVMLFALTLVLVGRVDANAQTAAPAGVKQVKAGSSSVTVQWNAVMQNDICYYYRVSDDAGFKSNTTRSKRNYNASESYISGLSAGKSYYVQIGTSTTKSSSAPDDTAWSKAIEVVTVPEQVVSNSVKQTGAGTTSISLSWQAASGANCYKLTCYQSGTSENNASEIVSKKNSVKITGLKKNSRYQGHIYAGRTSSTGYTAYATSGGYYSNSAVTPTKIKGVENTAFYPASNAAYFEWKKANAANGYEYIIYDNSKKKIYSGSRTSSASFRVSTNKLKKEQFYQIKVRGYVNLSNNKKAYGEWSDVLYFAKDPSYKLSVKTSKKKIQLNWKKVKGASNYTVYISDKQNSGYKKVGTYNSKKTSATIRKFGKKALKSGKTYYVRIDASKNVKVNKKSKTFKNTQYYTWKVKVK